MMRIVHFELPADDPARCMAFYQRAFGWRFEKWDGPMDYWMVKTGDGPGIDGGLSRFWFLPRKAAGPLVVHPPVAVRALAVRHPPGGLFGPGPAGSLRGAGA